MLLHLDIYQKATNRMLAVACLSVAIFLGWGGGKIGFKDCALQTKKQKTQVNLDPTLHTSFCKKLDERWGTIA